jgi:hypothetical protein
MLDKLIKVGKSLSPLVANAFSKFPVTKVTDTYDAGLPDVKGPKPMTLSFFNDRVEITYKNYGLFTQKFIIKPSEILELEIGVQNTDTTGNAMKGAMVGGLLGGGLGAIGMAGLASRQRREDSLHLVINYKGQPRPLYFQNAKKAQKLYQEFRKLFSLNPTSIQQTKKIEIQNTGDIAKQLTDLNNLVQQGILTQDEFEIQKKKILST